jgi:NTE family protein
MDNICKLKSTALVLQGGGALGAYQGGVYEALAKAGHVPDWIAGISIGAINAAIIAGNPAEKRIERLRAFWDLASSRVTVPPLFPAGFMRTWFNEVSANIVAAAGVPGFFEPRFPPAMMAMPGTPGAISHYDTAPLRDTLLDLVDFDLLNSGDIRLSIGAVNVITGNLTYFDTQERRIEPEHIMASGALPPGFAPVMIDGEPYWDGGLVSNTPLQYVLDQRELDASIEIFQVDLFNARGVLPRNLFDVAQREKDIRYSSRTRLNTDMARELMKLRDAAFRLAQKLPDSFKDDPDAQMLGNRGCDSAVTVMHLINRGEGYETHSKDYEFSRVTVNGHWAAGLEDAEHSIHHQSWVKRKPMSAGMQVFDLVGK